MKKAFKILVYTVIFLLLTIITQIGGLVLILSVVINKIWERHWRMKRLITFLALYLLATYLIVPAIAPLFGREKLEETDHIKAVTFMTAFLNRNYVKPELNTLLLETEMQLKGTNIQISYLDANFPFIDNFPLLPHLSHNDGEKLDLSLVYDNAEGQVSQKQKSISGYGVFEDPLQNETNQIKKCLEDGYFQYDSPKYMTFGSINSDLTFSVDGTKSLILALLKNKTLGKLFIEPHLKQRLGLTDERVRYHGCRSVRHDDHIHIQLK